MKYNLIQFYNYLISLDYYVGLRKHINKIYYKYFGKDSIVISSYINVIGSHLIKYNLGDDLNYYLVRFLTGKKVINAYLSLDSRVTNYACIGSIIEWIGNDGTVIWGSGAMGYNKPLKYKPAKVCSVRGPLTRKYLLDNGIECPEIYGDPALLFPLIYKPQVNKRWRIGIIPHFSDVNLAVISELKQYENIKLISFINYKSWKNVIDDICSCDYIFSSSLHGLILSDAYNIPNIWIDFDNPSNISGGQFKYLDYFASVGRKQSTPVTVKSYSDIDVSLLDDYKQPILNLLPMIEACPFNNLHELKNKVIEYNAFNK